MPLLSPRRRAWSAAFVGALSVAFFQGSEPTAVVIEYRGPSNESMAPIVLAQAGRSCADVQRIIAARQITLAPYQCPSEAPLGELAALARGLKGLRADSAASWSLQPELLRATIFEADSVATVVHIPREQVEQALDILERHGPSDRYPAFRLRVAEMSRRVMTGEPRSEGLTALPVTDCGRSAPGIDEAMQRRIVYDLTRIAPTWSVETQLISNGTAHRLIQLTSMERRVIVSIVYLASNDDAARALRCRLLTIAMPRFRRVAGIGDEAYVLTRAHLIFRSGTMVFHVISSDQSFEAEQAIATRLIASTR